MKNKLLLFVVLAMVLTIAGAIVVMVLKRRESRDVRLLGKGHVYLDTGKTEQAISHFSQAIRENPENVQAHVGLIEGLLQHKEYDGAEEAIRKAEKHGLEKQDATFLRIRLLSERALHRMKAAGKMYTAEVCADIIATEIDPALTLLDDLIETSSASAQTLATQGNICLLKADILDAMRRRVVEQQRADIKLNKERASAEKKIRVLEILTQVRVAMARARESYGKAIELDPKMAGPRLALARLFLRGFVPNPEKARELLYPLLQDDPNHEGAIMLVSAAERLLGNYEEALELVRRVKENSSSYYNARLAEAELLVQEGRFAEVGELTETLVTKNPYNPQAAYLHARVLIARNDVEGAIPYLHNIFGEGELRWPQARFELAKALMRTGKEQQALQAYRDTVADVDTDPPSSYRDRDERLECKYGASLALARILKDSSAKEAADYARTAFGVFPSRREAYETAKEIFGDLKMQKALDSVVIIHAARLADLKRFDDAIAVCRANRGILSNKSAADRLIARCLVRKGAYTDAIQTLESLLRTQPEARENIEMELAGLYLQLNRSADAEKIYRGMLDREPQNFQIISRLVAVFLRAGKPKEAADLLLKADAAGIHSRELGKSLMSVYLHEGNIEASIDFIQEQIEQRPRDPEILLVAAQLLWRKGDRAAAREYYDKALAFDPPPADSFLRVLLDLAEGRFDDVIALSRKGLESESPLDVLRLFLVAAHQAKGDDSAEEMLLAAMPHLRNAPVLTRDAGLMLDVIRAGKGKFRATVANADDGPGANSNMARERPLHAARDSIRFMKAMAALKPKAREKASVAFNIMLLMLRFRALAEAKQQAATLQETMPDQPYPVCLKAELLDRLGFHDEAISEYDRVIKQSPDCLTAWFQKASSHAQRQENYEATTILEKLLEKDLSAIERPEVLLSLSTQYQKIGRIDAAIERLKEAAQFPSFTPIAYNDAAWLLATKKGDTETALAYSRKALEKLPDAPMLLDTLGWIHLLRKDYDRAVSVLERAVKGMPHNPLLRYHLGVAYLNVGREADARNELKQSLAIGRPFSEIEMARKLADDLDR